MPQHRLPLSLALATSLLAACGGGGGGSASAPPPAPVETRLQFSATNEEAVARAALGALDFTLSAADLGQAPGSSAAAAPQRQAFAAPPLQQPLVVSNLNVTLPCPSGGRILISHDDANNNGSLDTGDSLSTELQGCTTTEGVGNGRLLMRVREFSSTFFSTLLGFDLDVQALSEQRPNGDLMQGSGRFSVTSSETGTGLRTLLVEVPSLSLSSRVANQTSTHQAVGLRAQTQRQANRVPLGTQIELSATQLSSSDFGNRIVSLNTAPAFFVLDGDRYPSSGQLLVQGVGVSQLRIVALNASQLRLDRDADGDGSFESSRTLEWSRFWP